MLPYTVLLTLITCAFSIMGYLDKHRLEFTHCSLLFSIDVFLVAPFIGHFHNSTVIHPIT